MTTADVVYVDEDLKEIMPGFLENKRSQIQGAWEKIREADAEGVRRAAHKLKGGFNMYGLSALGGICADLEMAARTGDGDEMLLLTELLLRRFGRIKLRYR